MKLFLFHCWGGDGRSCWSGWLADHFKANDAEVIAPDFPHTNNPKLEEWLGVVRKKVQEFNEKDQWILVGHSLGCPTILRLLESFGDDEKVAKVILVAGFAKSLGIEEIENFVHQKFNWEKIKSKAKEFVIINSDNDPFVELEEGKRLAELFGTKLIVEHGAGHINEGSGFTKYERLLKFI